MVSYEEEPGEAIDGSTEVRMQRRTEGTSRPWLQRASTTEAGKAGNQDVAIYVPSSRALKVEYHDSHHRRHGSTT